MKPKISTELYRHGGQEKDHYGADEVHWRSCPFCEATEYREISKERGILGIVRCEHCSLLYTNPYPEDAEKNYFGEKEAFFEEARLIFSGEKKHHRDPNYEYELKKIEQHKPSGKLLDIGSNMGFFLRKALEHGFDAKGVEPSPALAELGQENFGLDVVNDFFKKELFSQERFDVITLIDVFEHVIDPLDLLKELREVLDEEGIIVIKVPNANYNLLKLRLARKLNREGDHDLFNAYEHTVHYTPRTFDMFLKKAGFKIKRTLFPLPIDPPVWANLVGHYYQYPSPFTLDWKRILLRRAFFYGGKLEGVFRSEPALPPDLMFIIQKEKSSPEQG